MDYDKLIERLRSWDGVKPDREMGYAITGLDALLSENQQLRHTANVLRADLARVTAERDAAVENVKHLKAVMRDEGIVVIPPKYPWERSEWNM